MLRRPSNLLALALLSGGLLAAILVVGVWGALDTAMQRLGVEIERGIARAARAVQQLSLIHI